MTRTCQLHQIRDGPFTDFLCPFQSPNESVCSNAGSPKPHYSNHTSPAALPTSPRQRNKGRKRGRIQMLTVIERVCDKWRCAIHKACQEHVRVVFHIKNQMRKSKVYNFCATRLQSSLELLIAELKFFHNEWTSHSYWHELDQHWIELNNDVLLHLL